MSGAILPLNEVVSCVLRPPIADVLQILLEKRVQPKLPLTNNTKPKEDCLRTLENRSWNSFSILLSESGQRGRPQRKIMTTTHHCSRRQWVVFLLSTLALRGTAAALQSRSHALFRYQQQQQQFSSTALLNSSGGSATAKKAGEAALSSVQWLGHRMTEPEIEMQRPSGTLQSSTYFGEPAKDRGEVQSLFLMADSYETEEQRRKDEIDKNKVDGTGGSIYSTNKRQLDESAEKSGMKVKGQKNKQKQVWEALASLEADMQLLDRLAGNKPQLSALEFALLSGAVTTSLGAPLLLGGHIAEFIAPTAAAFTAAIGIAAEYTGKVAVADGKEVAASSIQCAAEAEGFLANAERAKAITPLCVGLSATSATLALLVPVLLDSIGVGGNLQLATEIYLLCPLVGVLTAAVAGLAVQETRNFCNLAIGVGNRRFARSGLVGRSWLSSTELIARKSTSTQNKWRSFSLSVLPAPLVGALLPGSLPTKTIVVAALAAAETAFYLAQAEYMLSRACDAVALKARSAAVCDTYANQGARSAAILPFTSALSGVCAAATAAIVELPFIEALAEAGPVGVFLEACAVTAFPAFSALFAAAASVSKARCEVDAEATMQAASTIALPYNDEKDDPVLRPITGVRELIQLTLSNSVKEPVRRLLRRFSVKRRWRAFRKLFSRR